jgi:rhodanese-related sulfurtransferase
VQVVDVREPEEWAQGRIPGSVLISMGELTSRMRELDRLKPVVMVCRSGRRSLITTRQLLDAGFPEVKSLAGGVAAWIDAGQRLES